MTRYPPSLRQPAHEHDAPHISLMMAGAFLEETGRDEITFRSGCVAARPAGMRHSGTFARDGALILCCPVPTDIHEPRWSGPLPRERLRTLTALLLDAQSDHLEACWDLLSLSTHDGARRSPSAWIRAVRDQLLQEPASANLSALAKQAGRHRVHLGRTFLAAFGETPSVFRRRAMLDRGLCLMTRGVAAAAAAVEVGFVDQSHFSRTCRDMYGAAPGKLMSKAADVASVQYERA